MDHFFRPTVLSLLMILIIVVVEANHVDIEPRVYWHTILPHTPIPNAIEKLLQPATYDADPDTSVNVGIDGVNVNTGKDTSVNVGPDGIYVNADNSKPGDTIVGVGKGGVNVNTGKGTSVNVSPDRIHVNTGNSKPGDTTVGVGKGGVNVNTGKGTSVNVGNGGVKVNTGKGTSVNVGHNGVNVNTGPSKPGDTTVGVGKGGVNVNTGKGTSVDVGHGGVGVKAGPTNKPGGTIVNVGKGGVGVDVKPKGKPVVVHAGSPFNYIYAKSDTQLNEDPTVALFFLRKDLHVGKKFTLLLTRKTAAKTAKTAGFIPRSAANSIPFSTSELPTILSRFSIRVGSDEAERTESTLSECEAAPVAGERKMCSTSLESMVDFATSSLRTSSVMAVETEGVSGDGEKAGYMVRKVRKVAGAGGRGVVSCHPMEYAYAVFLCHKTVTTEVYEVEMEKVGSLGTGLRAVAVCHTDTSGWNPKHLAFRVLKVRPGAVPVCHFLPEDHVVWAEKV